MVDLAGEVVLGPIRLWVLVEVVPGRLEVANGQGKSISGLYIISETGELILGDAISKVEASLVVFVAVGGKGVD